MRIIDQDIQTWTATVETHTSQLQRCPARQEKEYLAKLRAARMVLDALISYRTLLDMCQASDPSQPEPLG